MQFHQVESQPHTYVVEDDNQRQLGTVDEFHTNRPDTNTTIVSYVAIRFLGDGIFEEMEFSGFTAALEFVGTYQPKGSLCGWRAHFD